jgi:hypothetical protein
MMPGICDQRMPPRISFGEERDVRCFLYGGAEDLGGPHGS